MWQRPLQLKSEQNILTMFDEESIVITLGSAALAQLLTS